MDALRNMFQSLWQRYHSAKRRNQIIIGIVTVFAVMIACSGLVSAMQGGTSPAAEGPQATQQPAPIATATEAPALPTWTPAPPTPTSVPTATPAPTATPTPPPTATPRPVPTATPRPPAPTNLSLAITSADIVHGGTGSVTVRTNAGAALTIKVYYVATGREASSKSLDGVRYADSSGNYTWKWSCETSKAGTAQVTVTATWNGQSKRVVQTFRVQ